MVIKKERKKDRGLSIFKSGGSYQEGGGKRSDYEGSNQESWLNHWHY